jgi:recombination protein RecA
VFWSVTDEYPPAAGAPHAGSLAPLEKTRGFGMTQSGAHAVRQAFPHEFLLLGGLGGLGGKCLRSSLLGTNQQLFYDSPFIRFEKAIYSTQFHIELSGEALMADERARAIELAFAQIEKQFGKGSIMRLGSREIVPIAVIPTGSISFDAALGVGGFPRGRVVEVFGPESSGKTTITLQVIAEAQKTGGMAAFVDAEHALDPGYAKKLGVDVDNLLVSQPDYGEQALEITEALVRSNAIDVLVVDSVAALVPKAELDGEMGDSHMGLQARLMSQALRKLTGTVSKSRTCLIFINQIREKIGVMFGNPETTTGGRALKFYSSVRVDIRRIAAIKEGDVVVGSRTKVKIVKNKVAAPFREAEFDILYGQGISKEGDLLDLAANQNIVEKSGSWYSYKGERIGQGRENARQFLKDNKDTLVKLEAEVRKNLGLATAGPQATPAAAPAAAPVPAAQAAGPGARVTTMPTGTDAKAPAAARR